MIEVYGVAFYPSRDIAGSSLRSLSNIPHCCLPTKSGPCLSPSVAVHPLRPAKDHRLGKLLPHQQPNPLRAHLTPDRGPFCQRIVETSSLTFIWYFHLKIQFPI